jgi:sensor histidine kinase YesM
MDVAVTLSRDGEIIGVIGIGIELTQLSDYLESLQQDRPGAAFIINDQRDLIASTVAQEAMPTQVSVDGLPQLQRFDAVQDPLLQRASRAIQASPALDDLLRYTDSQSGEHYYISLTRLDYLDWTVGTIIPEADYMAGIRRNQQLLLVVIVFFTICTAAIAIGLANRLIAQPVLDIAKAATKIEDETFDLDQDLDPLAAIITRQDEIGRLARIFRQMAHQVYQREQRLKQQIQAFQIEIDESKRQRQVKEIVETDFFQDLALKAQALRQQYQEKDQLQDEDKDGDN